MEIPEYDPAMVGDTWQGCCTLTTRNLNSDGAENTVDFCVEQSGRQLPIGDVRIVDGQCVFALVNVTPDSLERLADFLNHAADNLRRCSP